MEVLFDEQSNSFISFFPAIRQVDSVPPRGRTEGPISNQAELRAFVSADRKQLCVNNACPSCCARVRLRKWTCLIVQPTTAICNRDGTLSRCRSVDHMILTSTYTDNLFSATSHRDSSIWRFRSLFTLLITRQIKSLGK